MNDVVNCWVMGRNDRVSCSVIKKWMCGQRGGCMSVHEKEERRDEKWKRKRRTRLFEILDGAAIAKQDLFRRKPVPRCSSRRFDSTVAGVTGWLLLLRCEHVRCDNAGIAL